MCDDLEKFCRLCLDVESSHVSIFGDPTIGIHLRSCLGIVAVPDDHLPTDICMSCVSQLSQFYHFQINARCSQDWLESSHLKKKSIQPLPDSEYNSDSLLEFLNNTANIEEYLNNLGKEDIPSIVNMLDENEALETCKLSSFKSIKQLSPKKKEMKPKNGQVAMEIDVLDSDVKTLKEIILKKDDSKIKPDSKTDINILTCYGCKTKFDAIQKLSQHVSTCETISRTCFHCEKLFDSRQQMMEHCVTHNNPLICNCGKQFTSKERFISHYRICHADYGVSLGFIHRCKKCGLTFKDRLQIYKHVKEHILKAEEVSCDICGHVFDGNEALEKHKKTDHAKSEGVMYRCKVCNHASENHQEMYLHVKSHTATLDPVRHLCETCGKSFSKRAILIRHSLTHKVKCDLCGKCFEDQSEMDRHRVEHNETTMCERCGNTVSNEDFKRHPCLN